MNTAVSSIARSTLIIAPCGADAHGEDSRDRRNVHGPGRTGRATSDIPALLEAITGEVEIRSGRARQMKAWTLDITGKRVSPVDLAIRGDRVVLSMKPEHKTVYYELSIQ